jgi:hypothetical protein
MQDGSHKFSKCTYTATRKSRAASRRLPRLEAEGTPRVVARPCSMEKPACGFGRNSRCFSELWSYSAAPDCNSGAGTPLKLPAGSLPLLRPRKEGSVTLSFGCFKALHPESSLPFLLQWTWLLQLESDITSRAASCSRYYLLEQQYKVLTR